MRTFPIKASVLALASLLPMAASAAYFKWEAVELPASSGAACGDGSPYRFFVNKTPFSTKTVVVFEGGGACWDQNACAGKGEGALGLSILSASWCYLRWRSSWRNSLSIGLGTPYGISWG